MQVLEHQLYCKRKFSTGAFLWTLRNFSEHLFYRTPPSNCFRIIGHHREDLYFCGKFSCNTKLPVKYQPNISASKIDSKSWTIIKPFFKSKQFIKNWKIASYQFFFKIYKWLRWKKNLETTGTHLRLSDHFVLFKKQPSKVFLKGSCFECFKKFLGKRRPSLGYLQKWGTS